MYVCQIFCYERFICTYVSSRSSKAVEKETYLGYIINADMSDDDHIRKEIRNIYARGNMLIRSFKHCTTGVKISPTLFKTNCSSLYLLPDVD